MAAAATRRRPRRKERPAARPEYQDLDVDLEPVGAGEQILDAVDPAADATAHLITAAIDMYRQHLNPVVLLLVMAGLGGIVCDGHLPFVVLAPLVPVAAGLAYARSKARGHRKAQQRGHIEAGQLKGRHVDRIDNDASRAANLTMVCGVWLLAANLTNPTTLLGWAVWCPFGLLAWAVFTTPARTRAEQRRLREEPEPRHSRATVDDAATETPTRVEHPLLDDESDQADDTIVIPAGGPAPRPRRPEPATTGGFALPVVEPRRSRPRRDVDLSGPAGGIRAVITRRGIDATLVGDGQRGPTITRYSIVLGPTGDVRDVTRATADFQYVLQTKMLTVHAPVEGESAIGLDVPNGDDRDLVTLDDVYRAIPPEAGPLTIALGLDGFTGEPIIFDLSKGPHVFVGGETGSGKSACENAALCTILRRATPAQVNIIMIDIKKVELSAYAGIPHLITPIITQALRAVDALTWVVDEMERRYDEMAAAGVRSIDDYNKKVAAGAYTAPPGSRHAVEPLPKLLLVIDELAGLMLIAKDDVEEALSRITAEGRAAGIHCLLATQTPRADIITGKIKANVPGRIGFRTQSNSDSRVLLDTPGAEKLTGKGDGYLKTSEGGPMRRFQGPLVEDPEIKAITDHWRDQAKQHPGRRRTVPFALPTTEPAPTPAETRTAADAVLAAARSLAPDSPKGEFDKAAIIGVTPHLTAASRDRALTDLAPPDGTGPLTRVRKGWYALTTTPTHPTE